MRPEAHVCPCVCVVVMQPFWPMGTGCARGFLAALDTAWMVRGWAQGRPVLELLAERYRLMPTEMKLCTRS